MFGFTTKLKRLDFILETDKFTVYVKRKLAWPVILVLSWKPILLLTAWCSVIVGLHRMLAFHGYRFTLPLEPISLMGIAVAFYLGFKNEKAYSRYWEGRTIWGGIVNYSRSWGNACLSFLESEDKAEMKATERRLVFRHIAWLHALTLNLRKRNHSSPDFSEYPRALSHGHTKPAQFREALTPYLEPEELEEVLGYKNIPAQLVRIQGRDLRELALEKGQLKTYYHAEMMRILEEFYNLQGACERIKNTPLPRQYAHTSYTFVRAFCLMLPLGLLGPIGSTSLLEDLLTIPISVSVGWTFLISEKVGDTSEDPFENFMHDVPMTTLSRTIEIDLREMVSEKEVPEPLAPVHGILM